MQGDRIDFALDILLDVEHISNTVSSPKRAVRQLRQVADSCRSWRLLRIEVDDVLLMMIKTEI